MRFVAHLVVAGLLLAAGSAPAGPWEAHSAQGFTVRIVQDAARTRDAYVLERRYPDGSADPRFGQQGSTLFRLGPDNEGPATLRLDAAGRIWVAGATVGNSQMPSAVVLRFTSEGLVDASYAQAGRSTVAPAGWGARALDLAPLPDGGAWVVGLIVDAQGQERSGWWRLRADGQVDPRFGDGGLWIDPSSAPSEVVDIAAAPDGTLAIGLRRGEGATGTLEAWVLSPGAPAPALLLRAADARDARLAHRDGAWQWMAGDKALPGTRPKVAAAGGVDIAASAAAGRGAGAAKAPPPAAPPVQPAPQPPSPADDDAASLHGPWVLALAVPAAVALAWGALRRARRKTSRP